MKVTRAKSIENREIVLDTAARLFREKGFDGIGIIDLMKSAGLTSGGFYKNFESKEDLIAKSCQRLSERAVGRWKEHIANPEIRDPLKRIASSYLSEKNRDNLSTTCMYSTLAAEVPRHGKAVQDVFAEGLESVLEVLSTLVPGSTDEERRANAIAMFSQWVGALILSRAASDNTLSDEILAIARKGSHLEESLPLQK